MESNFHTCLLSTPLLTASTLLNRLSYVGFLISDSLKQTSRSSNVTVAPVPEPQVWIWRGSDHLPVMKKAACILPLTHHSYVAVSLLWSHLPPPSIDPSFVEVTGFPQAELWDRSINPGPCFTPRQKNSSIMKDEWNITVSFEVAGGRPTPFCLSISFS